MSAAAKQGTADGLCGIYCLINHMRDWGLQTKEKSNENEALRYLLQSAQVLGFLDPNRLVYGFEAFELRLIFNQVAEWLEKKTRAYHLKNIGNGKMFDACNKTIKAKGEIVVSEKSLGHWVLAIGFDGEKLSVLNSHPRARASRPLDAFAGVEHGLALIDRKSDLARKIESI
jgi:hypothetical protein